MGHLYGANLPSAGSNRFRFNGFAIASQPIKAPRGILMLGTLNGLHKSAFDFPDMFLNTDNYATIKAHKTLHKVIPP